MSRQVPGCPQPSERTLGTKDPWEGAGLQAWLGEEDDSKRENEQEEKRKWRGQRKGEEPCGRGSEQVLRLGTLPSQGVFRAVTRAGTQPTGALSPARPVGTSPAFLVLFSILPLPHPAKPLTLPLRTFMVNTKGPPPALCREAAALPPRLLWAFRPHSCQAGTPSSNFQRWELMWSRGGEGHFHPDPWPQEARQCATAGVLCGATRVSTHTPFPQMKKLRLDWSPGKRIPGTGSPGPHTAPPWMECPLECPQGLSPTVVPKSEFLGPTSLLSAYLLRPKEESHQPLVTQQWS